MYVCMYVYLQIAQCNFMLVYVYLQRLRNTILCSRMCVRHACATIAQLSGQNVSPGMITAPDYCRILWKNTTYIPLHSLQQEIQINNTLQMSTICINNGSAIIIHTTYHMPHTLCHFYRVCMPCHMHVITK